MRYAFIEAHRQLFTVCAMSRVMQVARSGYYAWRRRVIIRRVPSVREVERRALAEKVRLIFLKSATTYGLPRVCQELKAQGVVSSENRVAQLVRHEGLCAVRKRRFKVTRSLPRSFPWPRIS